MSLSSPFAYLARQAATSARRASSSEDSAVPGVPPSLRSGRRTIAGLPGFAVELIWLSLSSHHRFARPAPARQQMDWSCPIPAPEFDCPAMTTFRNHSTAGSEGFVRRSRRPALLDASCDVWSERLLLQGTVRAGPARRGSQACPPV